MVNSHLKPIASKYLFQVAPITDVDNSAGLLPTMPFIGGQRRSMLPVDKRLAGDQSARPHPNHRAFAAPLQGGGDREDDENGRRQPGHGDGAQCAALREQRSGRDFRQLEKGNGVHEDGHFALQRLRFGYPCLKRICVCVFF